MKTGAQPIQNRREILKPTVNRLTSELPDQFRLNPTNSRLKNIKSAFKVDPRTGALMQISERGSASRSNARFSGTDRDAQAFRASTVAGRRPPLLRICAYPPNLKFPSPASCRAEIRRRRACGSNVIEIKNYQTNPFVIIKFAHKQSRFSPSPPEPTGKRTHFPARIQRTKPFRQLFPIRVHSCPSVVKNLHLVSGGCYFSYLMLTLSGISKAYGGRVLFDDTTLQLNREDRIGLVGPNGAGKSTLLSLILGEESADAGKIILERNVTLGYLPQASAPAGEETVIELATAITPDFVKLRRIISAWAAGHPVEAMHPEEIHDDVHDRFNDLNGYQVEAKAKQILAGLSFREKDFERPAKEMSGGWVMRAYLARLLTQEPDLLLLDEPTNHLDLEALLWFQDYLLGYPGVILMISHDREFLNQIVGSIVEIRQSRLLRYRGGYDEYLQQREAYEQQQMAAFKH